MMFSNSSEPGSFSFDAPASHCREDNEEAVVGTSEDAFYTKWSASQRGYFVDNFFPLLSMKRFHHGMIKPPLINRGSFIRYAAYKNIIYQFLKQQSGESKQIVSLGSGMDTMPFCMRETLQKQGGEIPTYTYFEVDFQEVVEKKSYLIKRNMAKGFDKVVGSQKEHQGGGFCSNEYCLVPGDLRRFEEVVVKALEERGFRRDLPTLFLGECVLIYLQFEHSQAILQWVTEKMEAPSYFLIYEQIRPEDAFGQMMLRNLQERNIELFTITQFPTPESHIRRCIDAGFSTAKVVDMQQMEGVLVDLDEAERLKKVEILDEVEEWNMLCQHYVFVWAEKHIKNGAEATGTHIVFPPIPDHSTHSN